MLMIMVVRLIVLNPWVAVQHLVLLVILMVIIRFIQIVVGCIPNLNLRCLIVGLLHSRLRLRLMLLLGKIVVLLRLLIYCQKNSILGRLVSSNEIFVSIFLI